MITRRCFLKSAIGGTVFAALPTPGMNATAISDIRTEPRSCTTIRPTRTSLRIWRPGWNRNP